MGKGSAPQRAGGAIDEAARVLPLQLELPLGGVERGWRGVPVSGGGARQAGVIRSSLPEQLSLPFEAR